MRMQRQKQQPLAAKLLTKCRDKERAVKIILTISSQWYLKTMKIGKDLARMAGAKQRDK